MSMKALTATLDGVIYELMRQEDGTYTAVVPAPKSTAIDLVEYKAYPVRVKAEDTAGNSTTVDEADPELGQYLSLSVRQDIFIKIREWTEYDYFNIQDYNRIKKNVCQIKKIADELFKSVEFVDMGADREYSEYPAPVDFRQIEMNLNYICLAANLEPETFRIHLEEYAFLDYTDLNRIENACKMLFEILYGIMKARKTLPFKLGKRGTF